VFDGSGALQKEFRLSVPEASDAGVVAATALKDGRIVVGVRASDSEGRLANLLGVSDDSGNIRLLFRTNPFIIDQMCTGDNDTVWAYGWEESPTDRSVALRYKALRQYDLQKGEIQTVLDHNRTKAPYVSTGVDAVLHCSPARVFFFDAYYGQLFTYETATGAMSTLVAESLHSDKTITSGIVITDSGDVFASVYARLGGSGDAKLARLKRNGSSAQWVPVGSFPRSSRLFASSGDQLVLLRSDRFAEFRHIRP
jgi:hypothetical protein